MMTTCTLLTGASALLLAATVSAQNPPQTPAPTPTDTTSTAAQVTVEGCLHPESAAPGRKPNVAERAGIREDYILMDAKVIKGTPPKASTTAGGTTAPSGTTASTSPAPAMFEVKGLDDEKLRMHLGKRVQVDGKFENVSAARSDQAQGETDELVHIDAVAIRSTSGTCAAR